MTGSIQGASVANVPQRSTDTSALKAINSRDQSFVNQDFVKNISWLNGSVDTLSDWSQKLQAGVDEANQDSIEQLQGVWSNLLVMFAGGQPTGIDVGDVKYIFQALGAMYGIDPDTPFPLNITNAVMNQFLSYVVPSQQFSDLIYEAQIAWAEEIGLSPEYIQAVKDLYQAQSGLNSTLQEFFDAINGMFTVLEPIIDPFADLWNAISDALGVQNPTDTLTPIISYIVDLGIPFLKQLTEIVNASTAYIKPLAMLSGAQIATLSDNVAPAISNNTTTWTIGSNAVGGWMFDPAKLAFTTMGTSIPKRVLQQQMMQANPGQKLIIKAAVEYAGIDTNATGFGVIAVWYDTFKQELGWSPVNIASPHGPTAAAVQVSGEVVVPQNVSGVKFGAYVDGSITMGQVWAKDISAQLSGVISNNVVQPTIDYINDWILYFQGKTQYIPISALVAAEEDVQIESDFAGLDSIGPNSEGWVRDGTVGSGSARVQANGTPKVLASKSPIIIGASKTIQFSMKVRYQAFVGTNNPIRHQLRTNNGQIIELPTVVNPSGSSDFQLIQAVWTVPYPIAYTTVTQLLTVTEDATQGIVWFDSVPAYKQGNYLPKAWVDGLPDLEYAFTALQNDYAQANIAWATFASTCNTAFNTYIANPLANGAWNNMWATFYSAFNTYQVAAHDISLSQGLDFQKAIQTMFGIDPSTGLFDVTKIAGMPQTIADFNTWFSQIGQIFNSQIVVPANNWLQDVYDWFNQITGHAPGTIATGALSGTVPSTQVGGVQGIPDIGSTILSTLNQFATALGFDPGGTDAFLSQVASLLHFTTQNANEASKTSKANSDILNVRNNVPVFIGGSPTNEATFPLYGNAGVNYQSATFGSGIGKSSIGVVLCQHSDTKGFIEWLGSFTSGDNSGITSAVLNFYRMNKTNGACTRIFSSANIAATLVNGWNRYVFAGPNQFAVVAGECIVIEFVIRGSAQYALASVPAGVIPAHPFEIPSAPYGSRASTNGSTSPNTLNYSDLQLGNPQYVTWFGLGISNVPANYQPAQRNDFYSNAIWTMPAWMQNGDKIDLLALGGAGGGDFTRSGAPGLWATRTLTVGVDINIGEGLTIVVGTYGYYVGNLQWNNGTLSKISNSASGIALVSGAGGASIANEYSYNQSPGNKDFNGTTYFGGTNVGLKQNGSRPGGGGCWTSDANASYNTIGAKGFASITAYQAAA